MTTLSLIKYLVSREKYYAAASFLIKNTFELSDIHSLGQIYTQILQGLIAETSISEKFIDRLRSISINGFTYLSTSWNEFARVSEENYIDPYNIALHIRPNCDIDFNTIINDIDLKQTAAFNKRAFIFLSILFRNFTIDIKNLYSPQDITVFDFSAILQYHYHAGLMIDSSFYNKLKPNLLDSINNKYRLYHLYSLYPFLSECISINPVDIIFESIEKTSSSFFDESHVDLLFQCVFHRINAKDMLKLIDFSKSINFASENAVFFLSSCLETWENEFLSHSTTNLFNCESISDFFRELLFVDLNGNKNNTLNFELRDMYRIIEKAKSSKLTDTDINYLNSIKILPEYIR